MTTVANTAANENNSSVSVLNGKSEETRHDTYAYSNFRWKDGARFPSRLAEPLGKLLANGISEEEILQIATPPESELHNLISPKLWGDEAAAREYRLEIIRNACRSIVYDIIQVPHDDAERFRGGPIVSEVIERPLVVPNSESEGFIKTDEGFHVCVHVGDSEEKIYIPAHEAVKDEDQKKEMMAEAFVYLRGFKRRFNLLRDLKVLRKVFKAIDEIDLQQ